MNPRSDAWQSPRFRHVAIVMGATIAATAAVWRFLPLFDHIQTLAPGRVRFFLTTVLPISLAHTGALLLAWLLAGKRGWAVVAFEMASGLAVVAAGGTASLAVLIALVAFGGAAIAAGSSLSKLVLSPKDRRWPVDLGLGILVTSFVGVVLGAFAIFYRWILAFALVLFAGDGFRRARGRWRGAIRKWRQTLRSPWTFASVIAFETVWLLAMFVWVSASPPERRSDALRLYLPFIKYLAHFHHLPTIPVPWAFVIPEAGPAYSAALMALFGTRTARYAMPLCLLALGGLIAHAGSGRFGRTISVSTAVAVASIPIILLTSTSLMNEAFVSLCVALLAWMTVRSPFVHRWQFGFVFGGIAGVAVGAKYTTLVFVAPLGLWAAMRAYHRGRWRSVRFLGFAGIGAAATFCPWMWHAWSLVGNPFFPFLSRWIATTVYPHGIGSGKNLDLFRFTPGWQSWPRAPYDLTYFTSRYLEGFSGNLGLAFLAVLLTSLVVMTTRHRAAITAFFFGAVAGMALLWSQTAYVRYWLPAVWLLAMAAGSGLSRIVRSPLAAAGIALLGMIVLLLQIPIAMAQAWQEPKGVPWDYYRGDVSEAQFVARLNGGAAMWDFSRRVPAWPTVIETAVESCAQVDAACLEIAFWHVGALFDLRSASEAIRLVRRMNADYWAIDSRSHDARFFEQFGLARELWRPDTLVYRSGPFRVFRLKEQK